MLAAIDEALLSLLRVPTSTQLERDTCAVTGTAVSAPGLALLDGLARHGTGLRLTDLAHVLGLDSSTVSRQVQELVRADLVAVESPAHDRRTRAFRATPRGRQVLAEMTAARRAFLARLLSDWPDEDVADLARTLPRLASAFAAHRAAAAPPPQAGTGGDGSERDRVHGGGDEH